jgi:hypothetical protein
MKLWFTVALQSNIRFKAEPLISLLEGYSQINDMVDMLNTLKLFEEHCVEVNERVGTQMLAAFQKTGDTEQIEYLVKSWIPRWRRKYHIKKKKREPLRALSDSIGNTINKS